MSKSEMKRKRVLDGHSPEPMSAFDKAGRELAEKHVREKYAIMHFVQMDGPGATDFLAGRDSCKEALRVACRAIKLLHENCAREHEEIALSALDFLRVDGSYVGEDRDET